MKEKRKQGKIDGKAIKRVRNENERVKERRRKKETEINKQIGVGKTEKKKVKF